jgi:ADP-ribose pyrophosphatase
MSKDDYPHLELPSIEKSTLLFEGFGQLRRDTLRLPNQELYDYYTFTTTAEAVMIVATTEEGEYVINREYRHPTGQILLGLPGGLLQEGEDPIEGAKRELMEETGFSATRFSHMGQAFPFPGASSQNLQFVRAEGAYRVGPPALEAAEILHSTLMTNEELQAAIRSGAPTDGALCMAMFFHYHHE